MPKLGAYTACSQNDRNYFKANVENSVLARIRLASKDEFSSNKPLSHQRQKKCAATFNTLEPSKQSVPSYIMKLLVETKWFIVAILYLQQADKHKKKTN